MDSNNGQTPSAKAAYQDLFLRSIDAIFLVDMNTAEVLEANDSAVKMLQVPVDHVLHRVIYDFCKPDCVAELKKMIRISSRRYHPKTFETSLLIGENKNEIIVETAASPLKLNDQTEIMQIIFKDVTEKKESEKRISEYITQVEQANKMLEELATTDGMTGLINFRHFKKLLEIEHTRSSRYKSAYAIVFCDIDHFKQYNDKNGHPAGDELLKKFATTLKALTRTTDFTARYGGEEFVVLCPETNITQAEILAERIRSTIATAPLPFSQNQPMGFVSCSIGVSSFPQDGTTADQVLKAADDMLYTSKMSGRNKVTLSSSKKIEKKSA